ncbi:Na(+) H(+) exchange regulatory cofactor NHE-RF3, partial [Pelobates cultripes]
RTLSCNLHHSPSEMASPTQPRECLVTKQDGKGFGFCLRIEKNEVGHLVRSIEKDSSADRSGLKDGDRVLTVDGIFVDEKEHTEVVDIIKKSGNSVTLLVLDEVAYENAKRKGEDLSKLSKTSAQPVTKPEVSQPPKKDEVQDSGPKPRICYLAKDGGSYGFSLKSTPGTSGIFLGSLAPNGIAAKAGVRDGDHIIELNGNNVENDSHEQITQKVKESGSIIAFLLADKETEDYFTKMKMKITADTATLEHLPSKPRTVDLKKEPSGYGFYLRQEKNRKGHFIMEIDAGSPAEKANLKDYDRIVAVNGASVETFEHEQVVDAIRKGGDKTTLLIVDQKTDEIYSKAGISPYLYLQELKKPEEQKEHTPAVIPAVTPAVIPAVTPATKPAAVPTPTPEKPATTPAATSPDPKHKPRLCQLQKGTSGYGFNLNAIKEVPGQYIKQVVKGGPADVGGIKEDDILLEVNGVNVEKDAYEDVIVKIKNAGGNLTLLVISQEAYDYFKSQKLPVTSSMADPLPKKETTPSNSEKAPTNKAKSVPEPIELAASPPPDVKSQDKQEKDDDTQL